MAANQETSQIGAFYKSQKVFLTGGTGYIGTLLIEKLLRSTEVDLIYVLVRKKNGKDAHTRMKDLLEDIVFEKVKMIRPNILSKVKAIFGDCTEPKLGMSDEDRETIIDNVNIIFHNAANVKLNGEIELAYYTNIHGTQEILELAQKMKNLKSMVYVSTAYSNCIYEKIDEKFYESPCTKLKNIAQERSGLKTEDIARKLRKEGWPDSYSFTKCIAENVIKDRVGNEPIGIFRPAIVGPTYKEPLEGWQSNSYGPTGVYTGVYTGAIRVFGFRSDCYGEMIPGDKCVAGMIAAAWDVGTRQMERTRTNIPIYNFVTSRKNPLTWGELDVILRHEMKSLPSVKTRWAQQMYNSRHHQLFQIPLHYIPALVVDIISCLLLKKPKMLKMCNKIRCFLNAITFYGQRSWDFETKNTRSMWSRMNVTDREIFPINMEDINWLSYLRSCAKGIRIYILKDPMSTLEKAKLRDKRLVTLDVIVKCSTIFCIFYIVWINLLSIGSLFRSFM